MSSPLLSATPKVPTLVSINNKGGVGKTTVVTLTAEFAMLQLNKRVLIIDFDGQMNLTTQWIGHDIVDGRRVPPIHPDIEEADLDEYNQRSSVTDIFNFGKTVEPYATLLGPSDREDTDSPRVDIVACSQPGMAEVFRVTGVDPDAKPNFGPVHARAVPSSRVAQGLFSLVHSDIVAEYYDLVIIDTAPGVSATFLGALTAATHVLSPYVPEIWPALGFGPTITEIREFNSQVSGGRPPIEFVGFLPSKVDSRNSLHLDMIDDMLTRNGDLHMPEGMVVPSSVHIARRVLADREKQVTPYSIFQMRPSEPIRAQCEKTFGYILGQVFSNGDQQIKAEA